MLPQTIQTEAEVIAEPNIFPQHSQGVTSARKSMQKYLQSYSKHNTEPQSQIKLPSSFDIYCKAVNA